MILHAETALLPKGWAANVRIRIQAGRIAEVTPDAAPEGTRIGCLLPAPVNLHSHTFQRAMAVYNFFWMLESHAQQRLAWEDAVEARLARERAEPRDVRRIRD
ncbi:MAG TPA: hypothetical protein PKA03_17470, partial [Tabrizicola sp.]|nr:hypothetical protein [Tabrizicola sp.]